MSEHTYYMRVTPDKYELPMTPPMLASEMELLLGIKKSIIRAKASYSKEQRKYRYPNSINIVKVDIDSED